MSERQLVRADNDRGTPPHGKPFPKHSAALAVISFISFAVSWAALFTNVYTLDASDSRVSASVTIWQHEVCVSGTCATKQLPADEDCYSQQSREQCMQAVGILIIIFTLATTLLAALDVVGKSPAKLLPAFVGFLTWMWLFMQWGIIAGTYHSIPCNRGTIYSRSLSTGGYKMSVSFALYLCMWVYLTIALAVHLYFKISTK